MMASSSTTALSTRGSGPGGSSTTTTAPPAVDPYLADDYHPLSLASDAILAALRADESAPDADLYRRLISSSGAGAHRYHPTRGEGGLDEVDVSGRSGGTSPSSMRGGNARPTSAGAGGSGNAIGSPLGVLRGSRSSSASNASTSPSSHSGAAATGSHASPSLAAPPTPYLRHERSLPLPAPLAAEAQTARLSSSMGLLPEAQLVWLSADQKLFLWSYAHSSAEGTSAQRGEAWGSTHRSAAPTDRQDYCSFSVPSGQCVVSVGLVRPRPGVFTDNVEWCVVVTTPEEAILCALATDRLESEYEGSNAEGFEHATGGFRHGANSILRLIPTRFVLPTDGVPLLSVRGTQDGRIFLGGCDGNLYEMAYEGNRPPGGAAGSGANGLLGGGAGSEAMERAIDDYFDGAGVFSLDTASSKASGSSGLTVGGVLSGSKRVLSAIAFGSLDEAPTNGDIVRRPRKCRKINHSSPAPGLVAHAMPSAVLRAAGSVFGSSVGNEARKGGPIVSIVLDEERRCLYTLGSRGVVCTYDLAPVPHAGGGSTTSALAPPPRLASVMDAPATAKLYLDAVARGRMYPPSTSHQLSLGTVTFPGGIASAQAGVGGMDGARDILKRFDAEGRALKAASGTGGGKGNGARDMLNNTAGILHPVSLHLVPASHSKSLTLVAITGGGMRYYLSSLPSSSITAAQAHGGFDYGARGGAGGDPRVARTRPGKKMMLCHVRAPPPYTTSSHGGNDGLRFEAVNLFARDGAGGLAPGIHGVQGRAGSGGAGAGGDVVKGCYGDGVFVLALDVDKGKSSGGASGARPNFFAAPSTERGRAQSSTAGDAIVVSLPDFAARASAPPAPGATSNGSQGSGSAASPPTAPGGISEAVLLPMAGLGGTDSPVLPGGRTFDIATDGTGAKSSVAGLFVHSETPSDVELQIGLLPPFAPRKLQSARSSSSGTTSSALVVANDRGRGMISSALSALSFYLRSGQGHGREVGTVAQGSHGFGPAIAYRVSVRHGCEAVGFSASAGEGASASRTRARGGPPARGAGNAHAASAKAARLPSWLLRPTAAPLNVEASQHLLTPGGGSLGSDVVILNAGGLHFFANSSLLNNLAAALLRANNVAKDSLVRNFFASYGHVEGCAMCFALATSGSSSDALRSKAEEAALCYANRPMMKLTGPSAGEGMDPITSYTFQSSSLYEGLIKFSSRLLRPFWYKPAVVVTEGRPIRSRSAYANYYAALPAKVELLLDDATLDDLRQPLVLLQELMKRRFIPAVKSIPGVAKKSSNDAMDVDEDGNAASSAGLITLALQNQSRAAAQRTNGTNQSQHAATVQELQSTAFKTEDRNMHSLYRLLSRCVQLLNLMSCLRRAHETQALPEVQWGLLHGLTFHQLGTSQEGQQRIETLLNVLVSRGEKTLVNGMSTDGDLLADALSRQCYLFFSSASRLTYLGFRSAHDALSRSPNSPQRKNLANQAAMYLRSASRHWYSPSLVAGRSVSRDSNVSWEEVFTNAMEAGSPLALAADILMKLGQVEGLADVCLICAANFGGAKVPRDDRKELGEETKEDMLSWEKGLYHRPPSGITAGGLDSRLGSSSQAIVGIDITPSDALRTCHSIIFHYISQLLGEAGQKSQRLAEDLVATCAASSDVKFLHSMYEHLLATNNVETALRIDSSFLEKWLREEKKDIGVMWKYYSFHGRNIVAGNLMYNKAQDTEQKIHLNQRIEYLTRAANSFSLAQQANPGSSIMNASLLVGGISNQGTNQALQDPQLEQIDLPKRIKDIQDMLDVATIQKRVLTTINQSQQVDLDSARMDALSFTLMDVSRIYNEVAGPLNLFDVCLLILNTCQQNDVDNINTLWKSIICEEVLPCSTSSQSVVDVLNKLKQESMLENETIAFGEAVDTLQNFEHGEWIPRLRNRVTALGKELYGKGADYTFPLDLIVAELEDLRNVYSSTREEENVSQPWPAQTMLEVGVPFYELVESYESLLVEIDATAGGVDIATRFQRLASISELLDLWVTAAITSFDSSSVGGSNGLHIDGQGSTASSQLTRAVNTGALLSRIEAYKSALHELGGNPSAMALVDARLAKVEETIRRFY